ncbi:NCS2 family permease [Clostridium estertheticum]|uniref:NCS2 family permease n=1 Tax=Clostridium estertheticum TaxID=238834 RepID=A0A7Y3WSP7_9CLOT|nr:NCS2 family permease [Clostridium estertheticum]MBW9170814.1 NCS2 family permease [Clostridium estertheticum]NNU76169.1 NCS2 family permease [Clostridium estertheticum]WBL46253.1 NCS2 family permease [Clostridium estertheticum]WLC74347.1 NCS2 family permease [Clostridium estertheticum]
MKSTENIEKSSIFEKLFKLRENKTTVKTEILAGITTFITMAYIIIVNPNILRFAGMNLPGIKGEGAGAFTALNDPVVASVFAATCLTAAIGTFVMAFYANLPFAQAPGMGLNAFFTYSVCLGLGYTWQQALAAVFISGILFIIITLTSIREKIVDALPQNLKLAISGGIGLFIALIGFKGGGIIVSNKETLVAFGSLTSPSALVTLIGISITAIFMARKIKGSILIGIVITAIVGIPFGITKLAGVKIFSAPPSLAPTFMQFDFAGLLGSGAGKGVFSAIMSVVMVVITFSLVDLFDTIGTLVGTATKANMLDENGRVKNMNKALMSDALATTAGAIMGTSTVVTYVESTAGVAEGGRTGLTSATVGVLFLASLFFSGVVGIVPTEATAPALVIVGVLMMSSITKINFEDFTEALPAFLTIAIMPFSYSIANGIAAGIIFYPIVKVATGRYKEVSPIVYVLAGLFIIRFIILP